MQATKYEFCRDCPLKNRPLVLPSKERDDRPCVIIVGEAPGATEARTGTPFVGESGRLLKAVVARAWGDQYSIVYANAIACHPVNNKAPKPTVMQHCADHMLLPMIRKERPYRIVAVGNSAAGALGHGYTGITGKRGQFVKFEDFDVFLTVHPAMILRTPGLVGQFQRDIKRSVGAITDTVLPKWTVLDTPEAATNYLSGLLTAKAISLDTETTGLDPWRDELICISLTAELDHGYVVYRDVLLDEHVKDALIRLFNAAAKFHDIEAFWHGREVQGPAFVFHNAKFDQKFLHMLFESYPPAMCDTMVMHSDLYLGEQHGLKFIASDLCDAPMYEDDLKKYKKGSKLLIAPLDKLSPYAAYDAAYTLQAHVAMRPQIDAAARLRDIMIRKMQTSAALLDIELTGLRVDMEAQRPLETELIKRTDALELEAREMVNDAKLNLRSTQQVAHITYDVLNLKPRVRITDKLSGRRQTSHKNVPKRTTNVDYLESVSYHPFAKLVMEHRSVSKLLSTYVRKLPLIADANHRIHTTFNQHVAITDRLSSSTPINLQNLPHEGGVRELIIASPGCVMLELDYSQVEYRVVAVFSRDDWMVAQYRAGKDLHDQLAIELFGTDYTKVQRVIAKGINFGLVYGMTAETLAAGQSITVVDATRYRRQYFERAPRLRTWIAAQKAIAKSGKPITTPVGRQWRWGVITRSNVRDIEKFAVNYPVQCTAGVILTTALMEIWRDLREYLRIVSTVHDSIYIETTPENVDAVVKSCRAIMEDVPRRYLGDLVPFVVDVSIGSAMQPMVKYKQGIDALPFVRI